MTNSKAYLSFVLFAFLLSPHVLAHELPVGNKHSGEGNNFKYPTLSQDLEKDWRHGSIDIEERIPTHNAKVNELKGSTSGSIDYHPNDFQWTFPSVPPKVEMDHYASSMYQFSPFPPPPNPIPPAPPDPIKLYPLPPPPCPFACQRAFPLVSPKAKRDHYTHSVGYQFSGLQDIEPENYEDTSIMRHRKMMRPSKIDWRSFHVFPAKTSSMTHGGKRSYGDIGEETIN